VAVERAAVDEVGEAVALGEVDQEGPGAARVAHRHQVLEERHLHRRAVEQHPAVPTEMRLLFDEG